MDAYHLQKPLARRLSEAPAQFSESKLTHHDLISMPLLAAAFTAPSWVHTLQDFWAIILPIGGAILLILQIVYYWRQIR